MIKLLAMTVITIFVIGKYIYDVKKGKYVPSWKRNDD